MTTVAANERLLANEVEWRRCERDPVYFLNLYWSIEIVGAGYELPGLRDYQVEDIGKMLGACRGREKERQIKLKARQIGWTTIAYGFAFWDAFFHQNHPWLGAQQSEDEAKQTLQKKVRVPYLRLPAWMRERGPKLTTDNTQEMVFDNGSSVTAVHSGAAAARGRAVYGVIMDEGAFMEDAESLFGALDPLCYGPLFLFSTANGMGNFFHEIWMDSELVDSEWDRGFHPWSVVPGRDVEWYNRTKRRYRTREWLFYQEYPSTPVEAFAKSGRTALPVDTLTTQGHWCEPLARFDISLLDCDGMEGLDPEAALDRALIPDLEMRDFELHVWAYPFTERADDGQLLRQPNFTVAVDVAEGLEDGDFSAISVSDANTLEQVATVRARIPIEDLGAVVEWLGYWYFTALIGVERNNQGLVPLQYLALRQYPRLYRMDSIAMQRRGDRTPRYGWFTNKSTKPKMVIDFLKALRGNLYLMHDSRFLQEAGTFISDGSGGYGASAKAHDDLLIATLIDYQLCLGVGQYPTVWQDTTAKPVTFDDVFGVLMPKDQQARGSSPLYSPIGRHATRSQIVRSWQMSPQNVVDASGYQ